MFYFENKTLSANTIRHWWFLPNTLPHGRNGEYIYALCNLRNVILLMFFTERHKMGERIVIMSEALCVINSGLILKRYLLQRLLQLFWIKAKSIGIQITYLHC